MRDALIEVILNNNKQARMYIEMAYANCRCTLDAREIEEFAIQIIVNPSRVGMPQKVVLEQSFKLLKLVELYHQKTAASSNSNSKIRNIKFSDELENLANDDKELYL